MDEIPPPAAQNVFLFCSAAICLITLSMLFSIAESSFLSLNKLRLRSRIKRGDKHAILSGKLLEKKESMLNTLLVANELVNILLSVLLTAAFVKLFGQAGVGVATVTTTVLLLVFGEITPKSISTRHPDTIAYALSGFVSVVCVILRPIVAIFTIVSHLTLSVLGIRIKKERKSFTEEEIKSIIDEGKEGGVLDKNEHNMMSRVFRFTDLDAHDIMIPRTNIVAVPHTASYRDILELSQRTHFSRLPVYKKDIDDIAGVIYVKDFLPYKVSQEGFSVRGIMREPIFILGTKKMSYVQQIMSENKQSLAIVVDEYSGTDGIITAEDITNEIFGPITRKHYLWRFDGAIKTTESGEKQADGAARLLDVQDMLHIKLESKTSETIGGWLIERLDHIPEAGETVDYCGYRFMVEKATRRRIERVGISHIGTKAK